jgi:UDP-3-O-[3-hydroxymyristoyl] glucosamine N-acyltransferase
VEIGAGTTIDRAMIGETVIGEGTKLDNLVMIGHNCELGRHNAMAAHVGVAGSVTTGDYVVCAGQVGIADHVHIGEKCVLGSKSGVPKDIPPGGTYFGIPAQEATEAMKSIMAVRKLPSMRQSLRELEAKTTALAKQVAALMISADEEPMGTAA